MSDDFFITTMKTLTIIGLILMLFGLLNGYKISTYDIKVIVFFIIIFLGLLMFGIFMGELKYPHEVKNET